MVNSFSEEKPVLFIEKVGEEIVLVVVATEFEVVCLLTPDVTLTLMLYDVLWVSPVKV